MSSLHLYVLAHHGLRGGLHQRGWRPGLGCIEVEDDVAEVFGRPRPSPEWVMEQAAGRTPVQFGPVPGGAARRCHPIRTGRATAVADRITAVHAYSLPSGGQRGVEGPDHAQGGVEPQQPEGPRRRRALGDDGDPAVGPSAARAAQRTLIPAAARKPTPVKSMTIVDDVSVVTAVMAAASRGAVSMSTTPKASTTTTRCTQRTETATRRRGRRSRPRRGRPGLRADWPQTPRYRRRRCAPCTSQTARPVWGRS